MNAERTGEEGESFDHVVCAQGLMIIPDSQAALEGMFLFFPLPPFSPRFLLFIFLLLGRQ